MFFCIQAKMKGAITVLVATLASLCSTAKLTQVTSGWDNPTKLSLYIYVPDKLVTKPPILLVVRVCPLLVVIVPLLIPSSASSMRRQRSGHIRTSGQRACATGRQARLHPDISSDSQHMLGLQLSEVDEA